MGFTKLLARSDQSKLEDAIKMGHCLKWKSTPQCNSTAADFVAFTAAPLFGRIEQLNLWNVSFDCAPRNPYFGIVLQRDTFGIYWCKKPCNLSTRQQLSMFSIDRLDVHICYNRQLSFRQNISQSFTGNTSTPTNLFSLSSFTQLLGVLDIQSLLVGVPHFLYSYRQATWCITG